jgi:hypothetical protein
MHSVTRSLLVLALILPVNAAHAADPEYRTQSGGTVQVDPDTNRATITRGGVTTPLWDGTHRMEDGSILIINRGVAVPDEKILESREPSPPPEAEMWLGAPIVGYSPCEQLVRHVCGGKNQCAKSEGCNLARQLLDMEEDERDASERPNRMTYTSGQCKHVATDIRTFPPCRDRATEKTAPAESPGAD